MTKEWELYRSLHKPLSSYHYTFTSGLERSLNTCGVPGLCAQGRPRFVRVVHSHHVVIHPCPTSLPGDVPSLSDLTIRTKLSPSRLPPATHHCAAPWSGAALPEAWACGSPTALMGRGGPRSGPDPPRQGAATSAPRTHPHASVSQGPDAAEVADRARPATLRLAHGNGRACVRSDQAGSWLQAVPAIPTPWPACLPTLHLPRTANPRTGCWGLTPATWG